MYSLRIKFPFVKSAQIPKEMLGTSMLIGRSRDLWKGEGSRDQKICQVLQRQLWQEHCVYSLDCHRVNLDIGVMLSSISQMMDFCRAIQLEF